MTNEMLRAYAEVDEVLKYMPKQYIEKIPSRLKQLFHNCRQRVDNITINPRQSIKEQKIVYETKVLLTILKLHYWCKSEEEKAKLKKSLIENDLKLKEKYNMFS